MINKSCALGLAASLMLATSAQAKDVPVTAYVEARVGYETPTVSQGEARKLGDSASIGGEVGIGYDISPRTNLGAFFNYDHAKSTTCISGVCLGSDGNMAYGAKALFRVSNKVSLYGKVGGDSFLLRASIPGAAGTKTLTGVMGAIGATYDLTEQTYIGIEGNYADLGQFVGVNFQRRHVALTGGIRF